mmetsp:Transcript_168876/g.542826  ORF Transcript_168876/g.542826 Transcript_168876/m.542826 type:complete len:298 (-) Transcript_168876:231-1124(-)
MPEQVGSVVIGALAALGFVRCEGLAARGSRVGAEAARHRARGGSACVALPRDLQATRDEVVDGVLAVDQQILLLKDLCQDLGWQPEQCSAHLRVGQEGLELTDDEVHSAIADLPKSRTIIGTRDVKSAVLLQQQWCHFRKGGLDAPPHRTEKPLDLQNVRDLEEQQGLRGLRLEAGLIRRVDEVQSILEGGVARMRQDLCEIAPPLRERSAFCLLAGCHVHMLLEERGCPSEDECVKAVGFVLHLHGPVREATVSPTQHHHPRATARAAAARAAGPGSAATEMEAQGRHPTWGHRRL